MTRGLTTAARDASLAGHVRVVLLVQLDFDSGTTRVNSTERTISWGGEDFLGAGNLGKVSPIEEGIEQQAYGLSFQLTGIPAEFVSLALSEEAQGRAAKLWLGFFDADMVLIADPYLVFQGLIDTLDLSLGAEAAITLVAIDRRSRWEQPLDRPRYTNADQQARFPGDLGCEFVSQMADKELLWGTGGLGGGGQAASGGGTGGGLPDGFGSGDPNTLGP